MPTPIIEEMVADATEQFNNKARVCREGRVANLSPLRGDLQAIEDALQPAPEAATIGTVREMIIAASRLPAVGHQAEVAEILTACKTIMRRACGMGLG